MKSQNPVLTTAIACTAMALVAASIGLVVGQPRPAVALAAGLLIGAANGFLVRRALGFEAGFRATSIARLMVLTIAGVALRIYAAIRGAAQAPPV